MQVRYKWDTTVKLPPGTYRCRTPKRWPNWRRWMACVGCAWSRRRTAGGIRRQPKEFDVNIDILKNKQKISNEFGAFFREEINLSLEIIWGQNSFWVIGFWVMSWMLRERVWWGVISETVWIKMTDDITWTLLSWKSDPEPDCMWGGFTLPLKRRLWKKEAWTFFSAIFSACFCFNSWS